MYERNTVASPQYTVPSIIGPTNMLLNIDMIETFLKKSITIGNVKRKHDIVGNRESFINLFFVEKHFGNIIKPKVEKTESKKPMSYIINGLRRVINVIQSNSE